MKMVQRNAVWKTVLLTSGSFTGYNIGSGFATGTEALQFFASWGTVWGFLGIATAIALTAAVLTTVYVVGYQQQFPDSKQVYRYFFGKRLGAAMDYYVYGTMILITLTMMAGAGATIGQLMGLPAYIGSAAMGVLCVLTSLLGLEKLRNVLSYLCIVTVVFVVGCGVYVACTAHGSLVAAGANAEKYVAAGEMLQCSVFGIKNPIVAGLASCGLLLGSGFAWASATGTMCRSKKEAALSGVFSGLFYYASTAIVVYLLLMAMDHIVGKEVPMLGVVQYFLPGLSVFYSCVVVIAIFSTISGRLFLIGEHFGGGDRKRTLLIVTGITVFAAVTGSFIPFSRISNWMFSLCGAVGILLCLLVLRKTVGKGVLRGKEEG